MTYAEEPPISRGRTRDFSVACPTATVSDFVLGVVWVTPLRFRSVAEPAHRHPAEHVRRAPRSASEQLHQTLFGLDLGRVTHLAR
jgi:hypothetical protein